MRSVGMKEGPGGAAMRRRTQSAGHLPTATLLRTVILTKLQVWPIGSARIHQDCA